MNEEEEIEKYLEEFDVLLNFDDEICPTCGINFKEIKKFDSNKETIIKSVPLAKQSNIKDL